MTSVGHTALQSEDEAELDRSREWVKGHFADNAEEKYAPLEGKLRVLDAILKNGWIAPTETWKLQSLGVALGDAMSQALMLDWVIVDDEYGRSPALNWPGTTLYAFPQTMISKRVEAGEPVVVRELFDGICRQLQEDAFSGRCL
jgi:hypothetical protein